MRSPAFWAKKDRFTCLFTKPGLPRSSQGYHRHSSPTLRSQRNFSRFCSVPTLSCSSGRTVISSFYSGSPLLVVESARRWKKYPRKKQESPKLMAVLNEGSDDNRPIAAVIPNSITEHFSARLLWKIPRCLELVGASRTSGMAEPATTAKSPMTKKPVVIARIPLIRYAYAKNPIIPITRCTPFLILVIF